jgi:hypothetical protein
MSFLMVVWGNLAVQLLHATLRFEVVDDFIVDAVCYVDY